MRGGARSGAGRKARLPVTAGLKRCATCQRELAPDLFYVNRSRRDGLQTSCKLCQGAKAQLKAEAVTKPVCPTCHKIMRKHATLDGVYYCRDAQCSNYDRAMHVRLYSNGARAA